jgi:hypothetical protein
MIAFARMLDRVDAIVGYAADHGLLHEVERAMDAADNGQVIDHHHPESDCAAWRTLIELIRAAAEELEDIDLDECARRAARRDIE